MTTLYSCIGNDPSQPSCCTFTQCIYMTLKKNELLAQSDCVRIFKMHVYTLV